MENCIFCHHIASEGVLFQTEHFRLVLDIHPIQTGHLLLMSKDHYDCLPELPQPLLHELIETQAFLVKLLEGELAIDGVTIAINDKDLKDTGTHFHVHLIPRLKQDGFWEQINIEQQPFSLETVRERLANASFFPTSN